MDEVLETHSKVMKVKGDIENFIPKSNFFVDNKPLNVALILDIGTGSVKTGFATDDLPRVEFPTVLGTAKYKPAMKGFGKKKNFLLEEKLLIDVEL
jgi:hypothetical protein